MGRRIVLAGLLLAFSSAFGQDSRPAPQFPEDALVVQQLIHWTHFQKPEPVPQPIAGALPEPDAKSVPSPQQEKQPEVAPNAAPQDLAVQRPAGSNSHEK